MRIEKVDLSEPFTNVAFPQKAHDKYDSSGKCPALKPFTS